MRNTKAFFSVAAATAAVLLAGTAVMEGGPTGTRSRQTRSRQVVRRPQQAVRQLQAAPPTTCTTQFETATFTVTRGPTFVPCGEGGECTEVEYQVSGSRVVYLLAGKGVFDVQPSVAGITVVADPCAGVDGFGEGACHEQAIKTSPGEDGKFVVTLDGQRRPSPTSVAVRSEGFEACEILGLGLEDTRNPDQATQTTETVDFKGCVVEFTRDAETGEVLNAQLTEDSPKNCAPLFPGEGRTLLPQEVNDLEVRLTGENGTSLGKGKFGDGYISTGGDSCTTRVIGGRVYTWGTPCP